MSKVQKTNAMRLLERAGVGYEILSYEVDENDLSGEHAAEVLGLDPDAVFKTLVLLGDKTGHIVCCIPVCASLDLKAVARASGNKSVSMIAVKELLPLTGYMRGGCSPVGMKKKFPTYFNSSVTLLEYVWLSAGQRGLQMRVSPADIIKLTEAGVENLIQ